MQDVLTVSQQEVGRLEVGMDDILLVEESERLQHVDRHLPDGRWCTRRTADARQVVNQRRRLQQLEHQAVVVLKHERILK